MTCRDASPGPARATDGRPAPPAPDGPRQCLIGAPLRQELRPRRAMASASSGRSAVRSPGTTRTPGSPYLGHADREAPALDVGRVVTPAAHVIGAPTRVTTPHTVRVVVGDVLLAGQPSVTQVGQDAAPERVPTRRDSRPQPLSRGRHGLSRGSLSRIDLVERVDDTPQGLGEIRIGEPRHASWPAATQPRRRPPEWRDGRRRPSCPGRRPGQAAARC